MSSDVQSALAQQRSNDYGSLVIIAAVSYDYCLTFSKEVTYTWQRPWTSVSALFLLIRYAGYISLLVTALISSTFVPGPLRVRRSSSYLAKHSFAHRNSLIDIRCNLVYFLGSWAYPIFWAGADMVMILRVYAMYNRSRITLVLLLVLYITEVTMLFVSSSMYSNPNYATVSIAQPVPMLDLTVCNVVFSTQTWNNASTITQFILGTIMCILVTVQFVGHALQMYQTTRKWQLNRYMSLLFRDGLLYFLVTLFYSLTNMLGILGIIPQGWVTQVLMAATNIPLYTLTPRFVMNVRELYTRDTEGRWDRDIDTGFGLSSGEGRGVGGSTTMGTIAFVQGGAEDPEEIAMAEV